jgi:hypothetical protein
MRQAWNNVLSAWINVGSEDAVLLGLVMLFPPLFDHIPFAQQLPVHTPLFYHIPFAQQPNSAWMLFIHIPFAHAAMQRNSLFPDLTEYKTRPGKSFKNIQPSIETRTYVWYNGISHNCQGAERGCSRMSRHFDFSITRNRNAPIS